MPVQTITPKNQSTSALDKATSMQLLKQIKQQRGVLFSNQVDALCKTYHIDLDTLLRCCLPLASELAIAPISQFYVGAIALGVDKAGQINFYFGANVEFANQALGLVVHAEQSAINNAWLNGAKQITKIAISDAPCGHCRQFMNELVKANELAILLPTSQFKLTELLPHSFGPKDLENQYSLLDEVIHQYSFIDTSNCCEKLKEQALQAYVPYSENFSAVKISTFEHGDFFGRYAENAAYNPSLSPLQSAVSQLYLAGLKMSGETIKSVELLETNGNQSQLLVSQAVLASYDNLPELKHYCLALTNS